MSETTGMSPKLMEDINKHFNFLFDRGYEIYMAQPINDDWDVWQLILRNQDTWIVFKAERGGLTISFGPPQNTMHIHALIYFLSKQKKFIGLGGGCINLFGNTMKRESKLLQEYIDRFEASLESEFPKTEKDVKLAEQRYYAKLTGQ